MDEVRLLPVDCVRLDAALQPRIELSQETITEYADALFQGTTFPPVTVFHDGEIYWLTDGYHRVHAHIQAERTKIDCKIRQGMRRDALLFSVGVNATHGLRRTNADKRRAVLTLLQDEEWSRWSDREIARRCGVEHHLVGNIRGEMSLGESPSERTYTTRHDTVATMQTANIGQHSSGISLQNSDRDGVENDWSGGEEEEGGQVSLMEEAASEERDEVLRNHRTIGTGENEWYTPTEYIEAARRVLGGIDLDPASSEQAQCRVQAASYYTFQEDGLQCPWSGRVWLNPPYAQPLIAQFIERLVEHINSDTVSAAILLTHNYTDTAWFHQAESVATLLCFTRGRIRFESPDGILAVCTQGQVFFYYGSHPDVFRNEFSCYGFVR